MSNQRISVKSLARLKRHQNCIEDSGVRRVITPANIQKVNEFIASIKKVAGLSTCKPHPKQMDHLAEKNKISFEWFPNKQNYFEIKITIYGSDVVWIVPCNTLSKNEIKKDILSLSRRLLAS